MAKNRDIDIQKASIYLYAPLHFGNFSSTEKLPIFWGPKQLTIDWPTYNPPDPEAWRKFEILNIPQVVRFIYAAKDQYDPNEYDDGGEGPPPVTKTWECISVVPTTSPGEPHPYSVTWRRVDSGQIGGYIAYLTETDFTNGILDKYTDMIGKQKTLPLGQFPYIYWNTVTNRYEFDDGTEATFD